MSIIATLAWRNLWRNKRRSIITISSIVFSVLLASWMRSMQEGSYDSMINNVVKFYSGYLQIQDSSFWNERILENSIKIPITQKEQIKNIKNITLLSPRLESYALAANMKRSKPIMLMGINPIAENNITNIETKIKQGQFLSSGDKGVIIGKKLSNFLKITIKDSLILIGKGYHGVSAAGLFVVRGIMEHPNIDLDKRLVIMEIENAREFYSAHNLSTSLVIMIDNHYKLYEVKKQILSVINSKDTVLTWSEMQPEIEQIIQSDRGSGIIMLGILYVIISFGLFSVIMMMVKERRKEFGIIHAIGMRKNILSVTIFLETLFISFIGCIIGLLISYLFCLWFYYNPIPLSGEMAEATIQYGMEPYMFFSLKPQLFFNQIILIFFITIFISIFPWISISRLKITSATKK